MFLDLNMKFYEHCSMQNKFKKTFRVYKKILEYYFQILQ